MERCDIQFSQNVHQRKLMVSVDRILPVNLLDNHECMCLSTTISVLSAEQKTCNLKTKKKGLRLNPDWKVSISHTLVTIE